MQCRFIALVLILVGCQANTVQPPELSFEQATRAFEAQPKSVAVSSYGEVLAKSNNLQELDSIHNCYSKVIGKLRQVLVLDANGNVVSYVADSDNPKSRCFRRSYLGARFPPPPFSPFFVRMEMG
jgi:hypothetical protein